MEWITTIADKLAEHDIILDHTAEFRDNKVMVYNGDGEYKIVSFNERNHGYIRREGTGSFNQSTDITILTQRYDMVLSFNNKISINDIVSFVLSLSNSLACVYSIKAIKVELNKDIIQRQEKLPENEYRLAKITYEVQEIIGDCLDINICLN